jgi:hypothetical protein
MSEGDRPSNRTGAKVTEGELCDFKILLCNASSVKGVFNDGMKATLSPIFHRGDCRPDITGH